MELNGHILLCWHAERAGKEVLENTLKKLEKKFPIKQVVYLVQSNSTAEVPDSMGSATIHCIGVDLEDPTEHQVIYQRVRDDIVPLVQHCENQLHINISPGTPAMHSVWLMLSAGGAFPVGTRLWSSQYNKKTNRTSLKPVDFSITTYLAEIRASRQIDPELAHYEPEAKSPARHAALKRLKQYAGLNGHPLLLLGERGTGKTRLVETFLSTIKQRQVVALACGGLDSTVAESLLFGHVKGAFTGAEKEREGLLGKAKGQILFLDEVQDLPRNVQRELVRTLQDPKHRYRRLGSDEENTSDFELVCASNLNFDELRKKLYPDFLDRIAHMTVEIPPLRDCRDDIPDDWQHVWTESRRTVSTPEKAPLSAPLKVLLKEHPLAGNMRDLQRLAVLIMAWLGETTEKEAVEIAIAEWQRWDRIDSSESDLGMGSWNNRVRRFQHRLAIWAKQHYGDWNSAAKALECTPKTLSSHGKNTDQC
ncbi:sigma-54-dependent transcriptional regulator [Marinobacterium marinum]|uniref:Sigma 54-interacting transcriptional regulator n=1 Tax=Marinobacterium marinum TaxID=2756129 RepID=A0A7W2ADL6_9GAMM|nr:sigma 54-interacting transcriptional regulator [Marinobacterium marinum]MBA4503714.1 sigma 54-interacting transcriptional regulator [Marinobacterium marinum]